MSAAALVLFSVLAGGPLSEERVLVSPANAPAEAWSLSGGAERPEVVPDPDRPGQRVIRLPYTLTATTARAAWDVPLDTSLAGYGRFATELWVDQPALVSGISLYFEAPPGWYGAWFSPETPDGKPAWKSLRWSRGAMEPESPGDWSGARTLRVSIWQAGPGKGALLLRPVTAEASPILVVAARWYAQQREDGANELRPWLASVTSALEQTGIPFGEVDDTDLTEAALAHARMLILPYAPEVAPELLAALPAFIERGGKVMAFYSIPEELSRLLGIESAEYRRPAEGEAGRFAQVTFEPGALPGLPASMDQNSWNSVVPTQLAPDTKALGYWQGTGAAPREIACTISPAGTYLGHVLTSDDPAGKSAFLRAVIGSLVPEAWEASFRARREAITAIGPFADEKALAASVRAAGNAEATTLLDGALANLTAADASAAAGEWVAATSGLQSVRDDLVRAWATSLPAREGEFRAVWCHSAFGVSDWGWPRSLDALRDAGFTAVIPNMLWGGVAYYPSAVLPVAPEVGEKGDQIAQCVQAAHARDLEVHVWKVNWNLGDAPAAFLAQLAAEGRLQLDSEGNRIGAPSGWLCPSQEANFILERDSMLEVARNYEVDGLHFDYIRYPGSEGCFCPACRSNFEASIGHAVANWPADVLTETAPLRQEWYEFRREQIDRLVGAVADGARAIRPGIEISAAVFPDLPRTRDSIGQDWDRWIDKGWLDFVCPMDYTKDVDGFRGMVTRQEGWVHGRVPLYPGIGCHEAPPDGLLAQIAVTREHAQGFTVFNFDANLAKSYLPLCAQGATKR